MLHVIQIAPGSVVAHLKGPLPVSKKQEPPLPRPFDPPVNFSPLVMVGLEAEYLVGNAGIKIITAIANAIFRYKRYPTDEEYHRVAQQVVRKWKFLDTGSGCISHKSIKLQ